MQNPPLLMILTFFFAVAFQLVAVSFLPLTKGLTVLLPSLVSAIGYSLGIFMMARLLNSGANLSILIPLLAAVIPLAAIAVGMVFYGESAQVSKIILLVLACIIIGFSSLVP